MFCLLRNGLQVFGALLLIMGMNGCGAKGPAGQDLRVINGVTAEPGEYPEVVFLKIPDLGKCTGTFITSSLVLTAAHCTAIGGPTGADGKADITIDWISFRGREGGRTEHHASSVAVYRNPAAEETLTFGSSRISATVNSADIALVEFPPGTSPARATLADTRPAPGDEVVMVGYGWISNHLFTETTSNGYKRIGRNTIEEVDGFITFKGSKFIDRDLVNKSTMAPGDSGGPIFVDGKLVGVLSGGMTELGVSEMENVVSDLAEDYNQDFLKKHLP